MAIKARQYVMQHIYGKKQSLKQQAGPHNKQTKEYDMQVGDKIRVEFEYGSMRDFVLEEYRYCLGFFASDAAREACQFTPLCDAYGSGPESEQKYISNHGTYFTNQVPIWMNLPKDS